MSHFDYAIYPPAEPNRPWLAVVLKGAKPVDTIGCSTRISAEKALGAMRARMEAKGRARLVNTQGAQHAS